MLQLNARIGVHYFPMRDYSNLNHAEILAPVKK